MDAQLLKKLKASPVLKDVPDIQLNWLIELGECRTLKEGETIVHKGDPISRMLIILQGELEFKVEQNGNYRTINTLHAGEISGALPFSRATKAMANGIASEKTQLLLLNKEHFPEMIQKHHALVEALVHIMTSRVREFTRNQQQTEKMMALGKLSSGLAHELNNPAAAIVRASASLQELLRTAPDTLQQLASLCLTPDKAKMADKLLNELLEDAISPTDAKSLGLLEKSEAEDSLAAWLKEQGINNANELAERFIEHGLKREKLAKIKEALPEGFNPFLVWLYQRLEGRQLAWEIQQSGQRISHLVGAVKSYSHMDRSPERQQARLAEHIQNTITMLGHKLKQKNIQVKLEEQDRMPDVCIRIGELNQVWTNLLDNAIDAVGNNGEITVEIVQEKDKAKVTIEDNGQGIPEEILAQVFDPFFTTKKIGEGTGLGLDIAKNLVEGHEGSLSVTSAPACTRFTVCLPIA